MSKSSGAVNRLLRFPGGLARDPNVGFFRGAALPDPAGLAYLDIKARLHGR